MRLLKYDLLKTFLLATVIVSLFTGCDKDDDPIAPAATETLDQKIEANTELTLFQAAMERTRLTTFTKGGGPFTIFAPLNTAFNAIGINNETDINAMDSNLLVQILTYHIQAGQRTFVEIPLGPNANMTTQGGFTLYSARYPTTTGLAYINGAQIISSDIMARNGVMHTINKVLIPPYNNAWINIKANPDYSLMVQAVRQVKDSAAFQAATATVFAIPNSVMTAAGYTSSSISALSGAGLTLMNNYLKYHVVAQRIFYPNFKAGNLKTVQGANVVVSLNSGVNIKGIANPAAFQISTEGITCSNGVLYSINGFLKHL